ncbi:patellin-4-like [Mercurialis annua]|uniref:patellin-4-like n=1 Tax=Mercurialis annua TaxID=3986 RepID=UPI00215F621D|nr:patellin-4-like [Mercurialis annua]
MATEVSSEDPKMEPNSEHIIAPLQEPEAENVTAQEIAQENKEIDEEDNIVSSSPKPETNLISDLKESEKQALSEFKSKIDEAILLNKLFQETKEKEKEVVITSPKDGEEKDQKEKPAIVDEEKVEKSEAEVENEVVDAIQEVTKEEEHVAKLDAATEEKANPEKAEPVIHVDQDIALWGVPLLASKGDNRTDVVLLKILRAREFRVNDAYEMLRNILKWRKENKIDSILDEEIDVDLTLFAYVEGNDRSGHPVCYNNFVVLGNEEMINGKTFEEKREKYIRGRIQLMEKAIQKLDFTADGVCTLLQINDLKNTPLPTRKDIRSASKKAVELFQDNYPEFVVKNIFINVPFWYYAYSALFAPSLSQRTRNKFVYARSTRVLDTLLKYIAPSQIPIQYGGLKRDKDSDFSVSDEANEVFIKSGAQEIIEIPAPQVGNAIMWDVMVSGWEVDYKEEFVPADESSYTIIVQKSRRISLQDGTIRNAFTNKEPGKIVISIENGAFKKKRVLYRYKIKTTPASSSSS